MEVLKTELQREREKRDFAIFSDYEKMMAAEGQSATEVCKFLMNKYRIHSASTIYTIRNRVANRLSKEATK